ncbi:hypothetical protein ABT095_09510 [Kitasatospora sp. NPDC002227]|uniref:hypothetical protein n=1 Tax=Kitasatospora sp. NPDC002227 TaxID=3154773 RepID=UPI003322BAB5
MTQRALRLALGIHPAGYRREMGAELAAVFADSTAGAGRWATGRELLDLAAHGLRLRLGLGSHGLIARAAGLAAPFAAGALASGLAVDPLLRDLIRPRPYSDPLHPTAPYLLELIAAVLAALTALAAVRGRWTATRLLVPPAMLALLGATVLLLQDDPGPWKQVVFYGALYCGPRALWMLILLAAPRDLLGPSNRWSALSAVCGLLVGVVLLCVSTHSAPLRSLEPFLYGPAPLLALLTPVLTLMVATLPGLLRGHLRLAAVALAASPAGAVALTYLTAYLWVTTRLLALLPPAAAAATGVALALAGRRRLQPAQH